MGERMGRQPTVRRPLRGLRWLRVSVLLSAGWLVVVANLSWRVGAVGAEADSPALGLVIAPFMLAAALAAVSYLVGLARLATACAPRTSAHHLFVGALGAFAVAVTVFVAGRAVGGAATGWLIYLVGTVLSESLLAHGLARLAPATRLDRGLAWGVTGLLVATAPLGPLPAAFGEHSHRLSALVIVAARLVALALLLALLVRARRATR